MAQVHSKYVFDYSTKNIPIPTRKEFLIQLLYSVEKFIRNLKWRAYFFLNPAKSPSILPLASAGSVYWRSTTSCSTRMEPASTKGQNFFPTVITNPLFFFQIKNLHDTKLDASSKSQITKIFTTLTTTQIYIHSSHSPIFHSTTFFHSSILYLS